MKLKVSFNDETHRIPKLPDTIQGLLKLVSSIFKSKLPEVWNLQYTDADGDNIILNDEKDYEDLTNPPPQHANDIVKLCVVPVNILKEPQAESKLEKREQPGNKQEDDFQVIEMEVIDGPVSPDGTDSFEDEVEVVNEDSLTNLRQEEAKSESSGHMVIDPNILENVLSNMISKTLPKIVELTQQQLIEQKASSDAAIKTNKKPVEKVEPPASKKTLHYGVACSGCNMKPIVGIRYRCSVCPVFDYCEKCEETKSHPHNLIKMKQRDLLDIFRPSKPVITQGLTQGINKKKFDPNANIKSPIDKLSPSEVKYYNNLMEKAEKMHKYFPKEDFDKICIFINEAPEDMDLEELIENFKH